MMTNNQNFSNLLLKNIGNKIPITFELITASKDATAANKPLNSLKILRDHSSAYNVNKLDNLNRLIMLLENNIAFLKQQINQEDRAIDYLLKQLPKRNDLAPQKKNSNVKVKTISIQTEVQ